MSSSLLEKELAQLREQIGHVRREQDALTGELRSVEAELERLSVDKPRFDALQGFCTALDRLTDVKADELFWESAAEARQAAGRRDRARSRIAGFEGEISGLLGKQASLKEQVNGCLDELYRLDGEVQDAYAREARREDEYLIEREISPLDHTMRLPWSREAESERQFRKALLVALVLVLFLGTLIPLLHVPAPVRPAVVEVPERLVSMLKKEPPRPEPPKEAKKKPEKEQEERAPQEEQPKPTTPEAQAARKKAEGTGLLALKGSFKELVDDAPASRLGKGARLSNQSGTGPGQALVPRSLVALPPTAAGSSGGISSVEGSRTISRDTGDQIGGVGVTTVHSTVAELAEEARPVSSGPGPARTDEEIQIVFDKYKAALYRIYNTELRKNPTLRGKLVLRLTIEPGGEVSACTVQSNDIESPDLVAQIVARVKRFNFGPKEKVPQTVILYPIDFLPGG